MKALIIGTGSIGNRHLKILQDMGYECTQITKGRNLKKNHNVLNLKKDGDKINSLKNRFDLSVIASDPSFRESDFKISQNLTKDNGIIAIEKPLLSWKKFKKDFLNNCEKHKIFTLFNVRYHPQINNIIYELKNNNDFEKIDLKFHDNVANWYGDRFKNNYVSNIFHGGALNVNCHELDLLIFITKTKTTDWEIENVKQLFSKNENVEFKIEIKLKNKLIKLNSEISLSLNSIKRSREIKLNSKYGNLKRFNLDYFPKKKTWNDTYVEMWKDIINNNGEQCAKGFDGIIISEFCSLIKKWQ